MTLYHCQQYFSSSQSTIFAKDLVHGSMVQMLCSWWMAFRVHSHITSITFVSTHSENPITVSLSVEDYNIVHPLHCSLHKFHTRFSRTWTLAPILNYPKQPVSLWSTQPVTGLWKKSVEMIESWYRDKLSSTTNTITILSFSSKSVTTIALKWIQLLQILHWTGQHEFQAPPIPRQSRVIGNNTAPGLELLGIISWILRCQIQMRLCQPMSLDPTTSKSIPRCSKGLGFRVSGFSCGHSNFLPLSCPLECATNEMPQIQWLWSYVNQKERTVIRLPEIPALEWNQVSYSRRFSYLLNLLDLA